MTGYLFKFIDGELKLMKFTNEKEAFVAWSVMRHKMNSGRKAKIIEKYFRTFNQELYAIDLHKLAFDQFEKICKREAKETGEGRYGNSSSEEDSE